MTIDPSLDSRLDRERATAAPLALATVGTGLAGGVAVASLATVEPALSTLSLPGSDAVGDGLRSVDGPVGYGLVFALAAIPLVEILLVIPPALALGMDPILVGVLAFVGNALSAAGYVALHGRLRTWRRRRTGDGERVGFRDGTGGRHGRGRRLFERFGLGGLALAAPIATGTHLAAAMALVVGARGRAVVGWMTVSLALWTVALVVASVVGLSVLGIG